MEAHLHKIAVQQGYEINVNNGVYIQGKAYCHAKRIEVASALLDLQKETGGARPNISSAARQCKVSRAFVRKIELEVQEQGTVVLPNCSSESVLCCFLRRRILLQQVCIV